MKISTYIIGALAAVSVASGLICLRAAKHIRVGKKHGKLWTFRDLYEDNELEDAFLFGSEYNDFSLLNYIPDTDCSGDMFD